MSGAQHAALSDLVDAIGLRTGAWVLVERFGLVLTHSAGSQPCPPPVAQALLAKSTAALRGKVSWTRGAGRLRGTLAGLEVTAVELGEGTTSWCIGGQLEEDWVPLLAAAAIDHAPPVKDPWLDSLLHAQGPARPGAAPSAVLVVLASSEPVAVLARAALAATAGMPARVHAEADDVVVALPSDGDVPELSAVVRKRCPDAVAGVSVVPDEAEDWRTAGRLARAAACAARSLGLQVASASTPAVLAELVIHEAHESIAALTRELGRTPLDRLSEHDARASGALVATVRAWCDAGCDVAVAAQLLYVHPNTLRYRLRRASQISGLDLTQSRQVLALQLLLG